MKKILLVDDQIDIQSIIADVLRNYGVYVDAAEDGIQARKKIDQTTYDLIITDLKMPNEDGFSFIYKVRNTLFKTADTPILVITGGGESFDFNVSLESLEEDGFKILKKPFSKQQLLDAVCEVFNVSKAEDLVSVE